MTVRQLLGDCRVTLSTLEPGSVQAAVTSPPYYGLRDYGTEPLVWGGDAEHGHEWARVTHYNGGGQPSDKQRWQHTGGGPSGHPKVSTGACLCGAWLGSLGLEPNPELYIEHIVEVFRHVRRVLRDDGCMFVNLGDSYAGSGKGPSNSVQGEASQIGPSAVKKRNPAQFANGQAPTAWIPVGNGYKAKDLMMMPFRVAMALQADGWWLRSVIPWIKRNSMPEGVTDRPATAVEYVFLLSKASRYFWDADAVRVAQPDYVQAGPRNLGPKAAAPGVGIAHNTDYDSSRPNRLLPAGRNRRNSDWFFESWQGLMLDEQDDPLALIVNPAPFSGAHFATFAPKLVEPMVKASTSEKGQCPECGAPWVRTTERVDSGRTQKMADGWDTGAGGHSTVHRNGREAGVGGVPVLVPKTTGWRPTCAHTADPVPQTILDCFSGAGSTLLVADRLGRNAIGCELKVDYSNIAAERITQDAPLFTELVAD